MPPSDAVLKEMLRLLGMKRVPTDKLRQMDNYVQAANIQPDKAVAALKNYNTHPDTAALLADPNTVYKQGAINYNDPTIQDILQRGYNDARFTSPQFRGWFRDSYIVEPKLPLVPMPNSYALAIPQVQYQGAQTPLDYIDDAMRNLTKANPDGWYTGIWTGTPHSRAQAYAKNGEVNSLYVRMEKPFVINADENRWNELKDALVAKDLLPRNLLPSKADYKQVEKEISSTPGFAEYSKYMKMVDAWRKLSDKYDAKKGRLPAEKAEALRQKVVAERESLAEYYHSIPNFWRAREAYDRLQMLRREQQNDTYIPLYRLNEIKQLGLPYYTTNTVSKFVKNDPKSEFDGMINYRIYDGVDSEGNYELSTNIVPNWNTQVKRIDNFMMNPFDQNWSRALIGSGTGGYLAGQMLSPDSAQAGTGVVSDTWNPIESMAVGAGLGAISGSGIGGVGAIPGALLGAMGGLAADGAIESAIDGARTAYNTYVSPWIDAYGNNFTPDLSGVDYGDTWM